MNIFSWLKPKKEPTWDKSLAEELKGVTAASTKEVTDKWVQHEKDSKARAEKFRLKMEEEARIKFPDNAERDILLSIQCASREKKYEFFTIINNQYGNANVVVERLKARGFDVAEMMHPEQSPARPYYCISWENK